MKNDEIRKAQGGRLAFARRVAGYRSAREAALANNWVEGTYRTHESGSRTIGLDDAERYAKRFRASGVPISAKHILFGEDADEFGRLDPPKMEGRSVIPIMGLIGGGAKVEPALEQVPLDGLEQVELPFIVEDGAIGLKVTGDSMRPIYEAGDVIVVRTESSRSIQSLVGDEAAVQTYSGERFLKHLIPGSKRHTYTLLSLNADPMIDVRLSWASEIVAIVPASQARPIAMKGRRRARDPRAAVRR